ncbi:MAG TPA: molybdate ABC transporter substrate-binding protein [Acidimicrobiia bacterium]|nr:molybdate ABC transporter substrate-binding protein [Acidimicrobiia bacterium]
MRRLLAIATLVLGACAPTTADDDLRVLAASSLTEAFAEIAEAFEASTPGIDVSLSFAGSASLREQVLDGIRADVVVVAAPVHLGALENAGLLGSSGVAIATNIAVVAVPAANLAQISGLSDLGRADVIVGTCTRAVPCGALAAAAFADAGIEPALSTEEPNVRSLVAKLIAGELDAGIVYRTDVTASKGALTSFDIPQPPQTTYLAGTLATSNAPGAAERFVEFLTSGAGQEILGRHGFGPAP